MKVLELTEFDRPRGFRLYQTVSPRPYSYLGPFSLSMDTVSSIHT